MKITSFFCASSASATERDAKKRYRLSRIGFAVLFLFAFASSAEAQDLAAWFAKPANQAAYGAIAAEVDTLAYSLKVSSLPDSLLAARLEEAAKKKIAFTVLIATLKADTARYLAISAALRDRSLLPENDKKIATTVEQIALLLRAGIDEKTLEASLDASHKKLGRKAKESDAVSRAIATLSVVATANAAYGLSDEEERLFAIALAGSDLSDKKLDTVLLPMKGIVKKGGSIGEAFQAVIAAAAKGKTSEVKANAGEKSDSVKSSGKDNQGNTGQKENSGNSRTNNGVNKK